LFIELTAVFSAVGDGKAGFVVYRIDCKLYCSRGDGMAGFVVYRIDCRL